MAAIRFNFDREFETATASTGVFVERRKEPQISVAEHQRMVEEQGKIAYERGHAEGLAAARDEECARLATAFEGFARLLRENTEKLNIIEDRASAEMTVMALAFGRRLAGRLLDREPLYPIEEAARLAFQDLRGAPHIVTRVSPDLVEEVRRRLGRIAQETGIEGKLIVMGEPDIAAGDCRIEWADGGVVRSRGELDQRLSKAVETALNEAHALGRAE
jgi:flagellar assembly protein FliH